MRSRMTYQVRVAAGEAAEDVATSLACAAWTSLRQVKALETPDARVWPALQRDFLSIFKNRIQSHGECGSLPDCRYSLGVYGGRAETPAGPTYLLLLRGGLLRFVEVLSLLACRRFRGFVEKPLRRAARDRLQGVLHRALAPYLYYNEACVLCPARTNGPARRM